MTTDKLEENVHSEELDGLIGFESTIKILAINRSTETYLSSGKEHAAVVIENILHHSTKIVKMVVGSLNQQVFCKPNKRISNALQEFLLNEGKICILLDDYDVVNKPQNDVLKLLKQFSASDFYKPNIDVRTTDEKSIINDRNSHYTVGDSRMYRLEYDTERFHAKFSFNDKNSCKTLEQEFEKSFSKGTPFDLTLLPF